MTKTIDKAIEAMKALGEAEQNALAEEVLARIEEEAEWERLVSSQASQRWLEQAANEALAEYAKGETTPRDPSD